MADQETKLVDITVDGYTFKANVDAADDIETLEIINGVQNGEVGRIVDLVKMVVGEKGYEDMKAHYVKEHGKMRISTLNKVFEAIFEKFDPKG